MSDEPRDDEPRHVGESLTPEAVAEMQAQAERLAEKSRARMTEPGPEPIPIQARREAKWATMVPPRFVAARIDQLEPGAVAAITEWADSSEPVNLVLSGPAGTGKTHAAVAALRVAWERRCAVAFANVADLLAELRPGGDPTAFARVVSVPVLMLDDVGALRDTDWTDETLYRVVDTRWREVRPVVATTNLTLETLHEAAGDRVYERLCLSGAVLYGMAGESRRRG